MNELTLTPIEKNGQRVLTTAQLAEAYETTVDTINKNFNRNKDRYIEGVHFYRLAGEELKKFFASDKLSGANSRKIRTLYLWTERGVLLHAKSLNTKKAWEVYAFLMEHYFHTTQMMTYNDDLLMQIIENQKAIQNQLNALEKKVNRIEKKSDDFNNHIITPFIMGVIKKIFK